MVVIEEVHKKVAKELDIKESIIEECNRAQYEWMILHMKENKSNVKLLGIGKWIKKKKRNYDYLRRIKENENNSGTNI